MKSVQSVNLSVQEVHSITLGLIIVKCALLVIIAVQEQWLTPVLLVIFVTYLISEVSLIHPPMVVKSDIFVQKVKFLQWIVLMKRWVLLTKPCNGLTVKLANQVIFVLQIIALLWNVQKVTIVHLMVATLSTKSKYTSVKSELGVLGKNWSTNRNA